ncbi:MAG: hypothetical protein ACR2PL_24615 [Dehalococcoidia bacterium]
MSGWIFRDFIDARGKNVIHTWMKSLPKKVRVKIEKGHRFEPRSACEIAQARRRLVESEGGHTREHQFNAA